MKETKVYMNNLPDTCNECPCHSVMEDRCVLLRKQTIEPFLQSCPLKSLKTHDRKLVKEVCEKIRSELEKELKYDFTSYVPIMNVCNKINRVLDQIQKEFEK